MVSLGKYSIGTGDRFGMQGRAQLQAVIDAGKEGIDLTIVWNKSYREHQIIGTSPAEVREEADNAVSELKWNGKYFVDADHITIETLKPFIESCDFFTIDVASFIGISAPEDKLRKFVDRNRHFIDNSIIKGMPDDSIVTEAGLYNIASKYMLAIERAGETYRKIEGEKGRGNFITEISMDEVELPQKPVDLFFILEMISAENIPVSTIAPKFSGRFNKGVDYVGDIENFAREFEADLLIIDSAIKHFGLPESLKISVHSGSDKFTIYTVIGNLIRKHNAGVHIKTAGTTWLEEVIGLALSGVDGLIFVKELYLKALSKIDELSEPYAGVIDIDRARLPGDGEVRGWSGVEYAAAITHDAGNSLYNPEMRQLIHIGYKLAADKIEYFRSLLEINSEIVFNCVYNNLLERHIKLLFSDFNKL